MWKKLFIVTSILLVASLAFSGDLWFQLEQKSQTLDSYAAIRKEIHRRFGTGDDALSFITPRSPAVDTLIKEIAGEYASDSTEFWRDIDNMFRWITLNITYREDTYTPLLPASPGEPVTWVEEFWRTPEETLRDRAGDCEDLSCLLASMILNYNGGRFSVWVISMENQSEGHIAVALPVAGEMLTILDPTAFYITGPNGTVLSSRDVSEAVNGWLGNMSKKIPGARIRSVFNDEFRQDFSSTQEFIGWAEEQMK